MGQSTEGLLRAARAAQANAHAPYSGFRVGAAVQGGDGQVFAGANIENASFGLTICAERAAVAAAVTSGLRTLSDVVVVSDAEPASAPCGACRQVLHEFGPEMTVTAVSPGGTRVWKLSELYPAPFDRGDLTAQ